MGLLRVFLLIFGCISSISASAASDAIADARALWLSGNADKALNALNGTINNPSDPKRAQALMMAGVIELGRGQPDAARPLLEKSLVSNSDLSAYAFHMLGESYLQLKRYNDARAALERVGYFNPPIELKNRTRMLMADIEIGRKNYGEAERHLIYLERKWRRSASYPEILWRHMEVAFKRSSPATACRVARRLYAQYPSHSLVYDWGIQLQNVQFQGRRLGCVATSADQSTRLKRLQLAGETDRARREMETLRGSGSKADTERADMMLASFLTSDGYPDEALKILVKYYETNRYDVNYLLSLARSAARAGEFQTAVAAYQNAHARVPNSRVGREALFQAAFLSYQFQDYDGALRRFQKFKDQYARSGLAKDARWHLAWIRYLRSDFEGAYESFYSLIETRSGRRKVRVTRDDRAIYWSAMSLARLNRPQEAERLFTQLETSDPSSFYSIAARARRGHLPKPVPTAELPARGLASVDSGATPADPASDAPNAAESEEQLSINQEVTTDTEAPEVEAGAEGAVELTEENVDSDEDEKIVVSDFKDPRLRRRFETAKQLIEIGLTDWGRQELYEVERRTRNGAYLKSLIKSYEDIQSYHRAVFISDTFFAADRVAQGFTGAKSLWESGYPKAYKQDVEKFAGQFSIAPEWVWSIMRAESHFKPDVLSPVGARGLLQIMPETGRQVARLLGDEQFEPGSLLNPATNIRLGARYLLRLSQNLKSSLPLVAAAYNAGPHRVESWVYNFGHLEMDEFIEHIPFLETRNYVKKVVRNFNIYRGLYAGERRPITWLAEAVPLEIKSRPSPRENWDL